MKNRNSRSFDKASGGIWQRTPLFWVSWMQDKQKAQKGTKRAREIEHKWEGALWSKRWRAKGSRPCVWRQQKSALYATQALLSRINLCSKQTKAKDNNNTSQEHTHRATRQNQHCALYIYIKEEMVILFLLVYLLRRPTAAAVVEKLCGCGRIIFNYVLREVGTGTQCARALHFFFFCSAHA